jgi:4'-phosphopantetheinyl transferase
MQIEMNEIHVWPMQWAFPLTQEDALFALLNIDEQKRAQRFRFPIHKQRFIAARSTLRKLLSLYVEVPAQAIVFAYDAHKKPFLNGSSHADIQFNLSHSDDCAVFAFTRRHAIGVDVEKIKARDFAAIAKRFFSQKETDALLSLPVKGQLAGFHRIWARKEAVLKAIGKGLSLPLSSFSVSLNDDSEIVSVGSHGNWTVLPLSVLPGFQAAVATSRPVKKISYWKFFEQSVQLDKVTYF